MFTEDLTPFLDVAAGFAVSAVIGAATANTLLYTDIARAWIRFARIGRNSQAMLTSEADAITILNLDEFQKTIPANAVAPSGVVAERVSGIAKETLDGLTPQAYCCGQVWGIHVAVAGATIYHQGSANLIDDEVRHRDFGWDLLDWLLSTPLADAIPARVHAQLPQTHPSQCRRAPRSRRTIQMHNPPSSSEPCCTAPPTAALPDMAPPTTTTLQVQPSIAPYPRFSPWQHRAADPKLA